MFEFNPMQRNMLIALAILLLGGIGAGMRRNAQPPAVAFIAGGTAGASPLHTTGGRGRRGGASQAPKSAPASPLVVHVAGAVKKPGVYALAPGKRVIDAIKAAGGATRNADLDELNLAAHIGDSQQILVPKRGSRTASSRRSGRGSQAAPGMVNINTASAEELDALPGVGPSTAQKIVEHRDSHGPFATAEGLLGVKGIGPKKLAKMKPHILL